MLVRDAYRCHQRYLNGWLMASTCHDNKFLAIKVCNDHPQVPGTNFTKSWVKVREWLDVHILYNIVFEPITFDRLRAIARNKNMQKRMEE